MEAVAARASALLGLADFSRQVERDSADLEDPVSAANLLLDLRGFSLTTFSLELPQGEDRTSALQKETKRTGAPRRGFQPRRGAQILASPRTEQLLALKNHLPDLEGGNAAVASRPRLPRTGSEAPSLPSYAPDPMRAWRFQR